MAHCSLMAASKINKHCDGNKISKQAKSSGLGGGLCGNDCGLIEATEGRTKIQSKRNENKDQGAGAQPPIVPGSCKPQLGVC